MQVNETTQYKVMEIRSRTKEWRRTNNERQDIKVTLYEEYIK
jgi:hypothetical protein